MKLISAAFVNAKRAFGPALKDKNNPHFKTKYADLGACIDAVEQALLDNGIAFIQETFEDMTGVTVETVFLHESGETMRCGKLHVPAAKQDPQGYGSALTYARRYSLTTACGIAPEDDDGNAGAKAMQDQDSRNKAHQEARNNWLADQYAAIDTASSTFALKKTLDEAIVVAHHEHDAEAVQKLTARAEAKLAKAKPKLEGATA